MTLRDVLAQGEGATSARSGCGRERTPRPAAAARRYRVRRRARDGMTGVRLAERALIGRAKP
jgi:hypothetical protein